MIFDNSEKQDGLNDFQWEFASVWHVLPNRKRRSNITLMKKYAQIAWQGKHRGHIFIS